MRVSHRIDGLEVTFDEPTVVANARFILVDMLVFRLELETVG